MPSSRLPVRAAAHESPPWPRRRACAGGVLIADAIGNMMGGHNAHAGTGNKGGDSPYALGSKGGDDGEPAIAGSTTTIPATTTRSSRAASSRM